jgi:phage terminase large subunit-like protein
VADVPLGIACRDPRLLGAVPFHPRQLDLVDAIESHALTVVSAGRRGGKSRVAAAVMVWALLLCDRFDQFLPPHEQRLAVGIATSEDQAAVLRELAGSLVKSSPVLAGELVSETGTELTFKRNRTLRVLPCNARSIRGRGACVVVFDELGHMSGEGLDGPATAARVWEALTPSVSQFKGEGKIVATSTPGDSGGLHETLFLRAEAGELAGACAFRAGSLEMNPGLEDGFLQQQRAALGDAAFEREYLGLFSAGGSSFFDADELALVVSNRRESLPEDGRRWVVAIDPASGSGDPFACVVVGLDARPGYKGRLLVAHVERWLPRRRPRRASAAATTQAERNLWVGAVLDRVAEIAVRFRAGVVSDQHIPHVVVGELRERGITGVRVRPWTASSKGEAFQAVRARVATGRIEFPNDDQLLSELRRVRSRFKAGSSVVELGRSGDSHGDLASALASGVLELERHGSSGISISVPQGRIPEPGSGLRGGRGDPLIHSPSLGSYDPSRPGPGYF